MVFKTTNILTTTPLLVTCLVVVHNMAIFNAYLISLVPRPSPLPPPLPTEGLRTRITPPLIADRYRGPQILDIHDLYVVIYMIINAIPLTTSYMYVVHLIILYTLQGWSND